MYEYYILYIKCFFFFFELKSINSLYRIKKKKLKDQFKKDNMLNLINKISNN